MLNPQVKKILIGAVIAISAALITYGGDTLVPFLKTHGEWGPALAAGLAIALNAARKLVEAWMKSHEESKDA